MMTRIRVFRQCAEMVVLCVFSLADELTNVNFNVNVRNNNNNNNALLSVAVKMHRRFKQHFSSLIIIPAGKSEEVSHFSGVL